MERYTVKSTLGRFYVGDICYMLNPEIYEMVWGGHQYEDGCFEAKSLINGEESSFAVHGTAYGDGCYASNTGFKYGVDAGNIGCVPEELWRENAEHIIGYDGNVFEGHEMVIEVDDNYTFTFYLDGKYVETIYTGDDEEEDTEEDSEEYPEEESEEESNDDSDDGYYDDGDDF